MDDLRYSDIGHDYEKLDGQLAVTPMYYDSDIGSKKIKDISLSVFGYELLEEDVKKLKSSLEDFLVDCKLHKYTQARK